MNWIGQGTLSPAELQRGALWLGLRLPAAEMAGLISIFDGDGDGAITLQASNCETIIKINYSSSSAAAQQPLQLRCATIYERTCAKDETVKSLSTNAEGRASNCYSYTPRTVTVMTVIATPPKAPIVRPAPQPRCLLWPEKVCKSRRSWVRSPSKITLTTKLSLSLQEFKAALNVPGFEEDDGDAAAAATAAAAAAAAATAGTAGGGASTAIDDAPAGEEVVAVARARVPASVLRQVAKAFAGLVFDCTDLICGQLSRKI